MQTWRCFEMLQTKNLEIKRFIFRELARVRNARRTLWVQLRMRGFTKESTEETWRRRKMREVRRESPWLELGESKTTDREVQNQLCLPIRVHLETLFYDIYKSCCSFNNNLINFQISKGKQVLVTQILTKRKSYKLVTKMIKIF